MPFRATERLPTAPALWFHAIIALLRTAMIRQ